MSTLNFPLSPSLNQTYSFEGKTWIWNGYGWALTTQGAINGIPIGNITPASGSFTTLSATGNVGVQGNISAYGNIYTTKNISAGGNISVTGNVSGQYFTGNGRNLTGIVATAGSSIDFGNANVKVNSDGTATISPNGVANVVKVTSSNVTITNTVIANGFQGNGAALTSVMSDRGSDQNNWNALTQMGVYTVNRSSWSGTTGTPLDSQVFVGLLEVKNSTNLGIVQVFSPGTVDANNIKIQWNRNYWNGSWTQWVKITNDQQQIDGGGF